jgi:hypothetical protein
MAASRPVLTVSSASPFPLSALGIPLPIRLFLSVPPLVGDWQEGRPRSTLRRALASSLDNLLGLRRVREHSPPPLACFLAWY